jgi:hypothetical protein
MPAKGVETKNWKIKASLAFLENLLGDYRPRDFAVRLSDGTTWDFLEPGRPARFTLMLKHPGALRSMFWPPNEISLAEACIYDDFDIEGGPTRPPTGCGGRTCLVRPTAVGRVGSTSTRHCSPNPNSARAGCRSRGPTGTPDLKAMRFCRGSGEKVSAERRDFYSGVVIWRSRKSVLRAPPPRSDLGRSTAAWRRCGAPPDAGSTICTRRRVRANTRIVATGNLSLLLVRWAGIPRRPRARTLRTSSSPSRGRSRRCRGESLDPTTHRRAWPPSRRCGRT